jgi:hypothetical protein
LVALNRGLRERLAHLNPKIGCHPLQMDWNPRWFLGEYSENSFAGEGKLNEQTCFVRSTSSGKQCAPAMALF